MICFGGVSHGGDVERLLLLLVYTLNSVFVYRLRGPMSLCMCQQYLSLPVFL